MTTCDLTLHFELVPLYTVLKLFYNEYLSFTNVWRPFEIFAKLLCIRNKF